MTQETLSAASRDDAVPLALRPTKVRLRLWGFTRDDVAHAELKARRALDARFWEITEAIATSGGVSPIPSRDSVALRQGADYDWAWAAYLAGSNAA